MRDELQDKPNVLDDEQATPARYRHVVKKIAETPWAILPTTFAAILDCISYRASGGTLTADEIHTLIGAGPSGKQSAQTGAVAVIPIYGVIMPRADMFMDISGGTSLETFSAQLAAAVSDPQVGSILLDVDSPGGTIDLVPETAALIRQANTKKPVVAQVNTSAGSAAYWLASQAGEIVVSPSGMAGSIGVFCAHDDVSEAMAKQGVKTTLVSAGKFKTELSPYEPLSGEAQAALQSMVNELYGMFVDDVAKGRGASVADVRGGFGEGRMVTAKAAVSMGMADRVGTFGDTVDRMMRGQTGSRTAAATAFVPSITLTTTAGSQTFALGNATQGWYGVANETAPYQHPHAELEPEPDPIEDEDADTDDAAARAEHDASQHELALKAAHLLVGV